MPRASWKIYLGISLILVLSAAAYLDSLRDSFHYDDLDAIAYNTNITDISNIPMFFKSISVGTRERSGYGGYRPLVTTSLAVNYRISGLETWSYHVFNIAVHLAAVVAVFLLASFFLGKAGGNQYFALLAAGVFALHPANTNAVTYIIARSAVLCAFFYLSSFYAYVRFRESNARLWLAASLIFFSAALLTKENAATLPLVVFLYEYLVKKERCVKGYTVFGVFFLISVVYAAAKYAIFVHAKRWEIAGLGSHLVAQPWVLLNYLRDFVLPVNLNFYPDPPLPASYADPLFLIPGLAVIGAIFLAVRLSRKDGLLAFCIVWFFVTFIPEGMANLREVMLDYRLYLPSVGLVLLTGLLLARTVRPAGGKGWALGGSALIVMACFFMLVVERNKVYKDNITLWEDTVKKSPNSAIVNAALGSSYLDAKRYDEAVKYISRAFDIDPKIPGAPQMYNNLGMALQLSGDYEKAMIIYQKGLIMAPDDLRLLINSGLANLRAGRCRESVYYFKKALALDPDNAGIQTLYSQADAACKSK